MGRFIKPLRDPNAKYAYEQCSSAGFNKKSSGCTLCAICGFRWAWDLTANEEGTYIIYSHFGENKLLNKHGQPQSKGIVGRPEFVSLLVITWQDTC